MDFRRCLVLLLLLSFYLSLQDRSEPHFSDATSTLALHVSDPTHHHSDSPLKPSNSSGAHKDQHGCYHFHPPFLTVTTGFSCAVASTALVTAALNNPHSPALKNILDPPRA